MSIKSIPAVGAVKKPAQTIRMQMQKNLYDPILMLFSGSKKLMETEAAFLKIFPTAKKWYLGARPVAVSHADIVAKAEGWVFDKVQTDRFIQRLLDAEYIAQPSLNFFKPKYYITEAGIQALEAHRKANAS